MTDRPSAGAHVIVQLVVVLDERTCQQLRALLADDIATRDTLTPAVYSLAGIATLIDTLGCVPTIEEYEHARTAHPAWPHHSSLGRRYGSWLSAVNAAVKVTSDPPSWGLPARTQPQRTFTRADCVRAINRCKRAIGDCQTNANTRSGNASKRTSAAEPERSTEPHPASRRSANDYAAGPTHSNSPAVARDRLHVVERATKANRSHVRTVRVAGCAGGPVSIVRPLIPGDRAARLRSCSERGRCARGCWTDPSRPRCSRGSETSRR